MARKKKSEAMPEELEATWNALAKDMGHRCEVASFKTGLIEEGTVTSVVYDSRYISKFVYLITLDNGRRIVSRTDSDCVTILSEMDEDYSPDRYYKHRAAPWTEEECEEHLKPYEENVGREIEWDREATVDMCRRVITEKGRIVSAGCNANQHYVVYRVAMYGDTTGRFPKKVRADREDIRIGKEYGQEGREIHAKYRERRKAIGKKVSVPDKIVQHELAIKQLQTEMEKIQKRLDERKKSLADIKEQYLKDLGL